MTYIDPQLQPILDKNDIIVTPSGDHGWQQESIGNGLYRVTLPDGQQVIVDQNGNIVG